MPVEAAVGAGPESDADESRTASPSFGAVRTESFVETPESATVESIVWKFSHSGEAADLGV